MLLLFYNFYKRYFLDWTQKLFKMIIHFKTFL